MTRKVVEFVENNVGMVEDNLGQVFNNLEEAWGNMVEEYFSGDDVGALQVIVFSYFLTDPLNIKPHLNTTLNTTSIFDIVSKVAVGAILLLISLPYWIYHCLAGNTIQCKSFLWLKCFSPQGTVSVCSEMPSTLATFHMICAQPVANK